MTNLKRLLVGAIAILATTTVIPTVGASASTLDSGRTYNIESHFDADTLGSLGVSQATGWKTSDYSKYKDTSKEATSTSKSQSTQVTQSRTSEGWNIVDIDHIYFCDANGNKKTGWVKDCGWLYFNTDGTLARDKWVQDGGNWYYLQPDGKLLWDTYYNGYYLNNKGVWQSSLDDSSKGFNNGIVLSKDSSISGYTELSYQEFRDKWSSGHIGVKTTSGSTNGGNVTTALHFYLK